MNDSSNPNRSIHRRDLLKGATAAGLGLAAFANVPTDAATAATTSGSDVIRKENAKPGTRDWLLTNQYIDPDTWWRCPRIEGYCSEASVAAPPRRTLFKPSLKCLKNSASTRDELSFAFSI